MTCTPLPVPSNDRLLVADTVLGMRACTISTDGRAIMSCAVTPSSSQAITNATSVSVNAAKTHALVTDGTTGFTHLCRFSLATGAGGPLVSCGFGVNAIYSGNSKAIVTAFHPKSRYAYAVRSVRVKRERERGGAARRPMHSTRRTTHTVCELPAATPRIPTCTCRQDPTLRLPPPPLPQTNIPPMIQSSFTGNSISACATGTTAPQPCRTAVPGLPCAGRSCLPPSPPTAARCTGRRRARQASA